MPVKVSASKQPLSRPLSRRFAVNPAHLVPNCDVGSTGRGHPFLNPHFSPPWEVRGACLGINRRNGLDSAARCLAA